MRRMFERMDEPLRMPSTRGEAEVMKLRTTRVAIGLLATAMLLVTAAVAMAGTFIGTNAPERLIGTPFADTMDAKGGNDRVVGRAGDDQIDLGWGWDRAHGGLGNDTIYGGARNHRMHGGAPGGPAGRPPRPPRPRGGAGPAT